MLLRLTKCISQITGPSQKFLQRTREYVTNINTHIYQSKKTYLYKHKNMYTQMHTHIYTLPHTHRLIVPQFTNNTQTNYKSQNS